MRRMLRMARAEQRKTSQLRRVWLFLKSSHGKLILILRRYVRFHEVGRLWGTGSVTKNMKLFSSFTLCYLSISHSLSVSSSLSLLLSTTFLTIIIQYFLTFYSSLLKNSFLPHAPFMFTEKFFPSCSLLVYWKILPLHRCGKWSVRQSRRVLCGVSHSNWSLSLTVSWSSSWPAPLLTVSYSWMTSLIRWERVGFISRRTMFHRLRWCKKNHWIQLLSKEVRIAVLSYCQMYREWSSCGVTSLGMF